MSDDDYEAGDVNTIAGDDLDDDLDDEEEVEEEIEEEIDYEDGDVNALGEGRCR